MKTSGRYGTSCNERLAFLPMPDRLQIDTYINSEPCLSAGLFFNKAGGNGNTAIYIATSNQIMIRLLFNHLPRHCTNGAKTLILKYCNTCTFILLYSQKPSH